MSHNLFVEKWMSWEGSQQFPSKNPDFWPLEEISKSLRNIRFLRYYTAGLIEDCRLDLHWHFCCLGPISNLRPVLDSLAQTTRGMLLDFCCEASKHARLTSRQSAVFSRGF